ncbi:hypothetical protein CNR22_04885 [Sphingobacteriaceae bacterium]|nr:hypothetical protein CNR22_04885 [Sphingobacteriaceae bacterium]
MKNSIITYLLGFFFLISCFKAMSNIKHFSDPDVCLEIDGKISNANDGEDKTCLVELFTANNLVSWATLKDGKKAFKFALKKNTVYTIRISKRGYVSRLVCVNTKTSADPEDLFSFSFETKLLKNEEAEKMNKEFLDLPIALIYFDTKKDCFIYDREYTSKVKKEVALK